MDSASHRRPAIDVLRAVAALAVVFGHAGLLVDAAHVRRTGVLAFVAQNGWKGIYLFFAISGYLIGRPFVRAAAGLASPPRIGDYARRRAARILPAHWLALTAMAVLLLVDAGAIPQDLTAVRYVIHMLLVQNFAPGVASTVLPVTWTLGIEAIFYVSVPLVFIAATRGWRRPLRPAHVLLGTAAAAAAGMGVLLVAARGPETPATVGSVAVDNVLSPVIGYLLFFAPGIAVAALEARAHLGRRSTVLDAAQRHPGACLSLAAGLWVASGAISGGGVFGEACLLAIDAAFGGVAVLGVVAGMSGVRFPGWCVLLGESSYGLYLWHWIVINATFWLAGALRVPTAVWSSQPVDWVVVVALTLPFAVGSWKLIERPAMLRARARETRERRAVLLAA